MKRPPERWSIVIAAIAVAAGVRADICMIAVPSLTVSVAAPHQASGVSASEPYASAVQTELKPSRSASLTASSAPAGGPADQYPVLYPSFRSVMPRTVDEHPPRPAVRPLREQLACSRRELFTSSGGGAGRMGRWVMTGSW